MPMLDERSAGERNAEEARTLREAFRGRQTEVGRYLEVKLLPFGLACFDRM